MCASCGASSTSSTPCPHPYPYRSNVCQLWCIMHILNPMPTREDKDRLVEYSGKTNKQVGALGGRGEGDTWGRMPVMAGARMQ